MLSEQRKRAIAEAAEEAERRDLEARGYIQSAWICINTIRFGELRGQPVDAWLQRGVNALVKASIPVQHMPPEVVADWVVASNCLSVLAIVASRDALVKADREG